MDDTEAKAGHDPEFVARANTTDVRLRADLERLATRVYSEEGIPMFLACENLVSEQAAVTLTPLNENLASAFRRDADAWQRLWPDAPVTDISKLIEILADRESTADGGSAPDL